MKKLFCPQCGAKLTDDAKFCALCGCKLETDAAQVTEETTTNAKTETNAAAKPQVQFKEQAADRIQAGPHADVKGSNAFDEAMRKVKESNWDGLQKIIKAELFVSDGRISRGE